MTCPAASPPALADRVDDLDVAEGGGEHEVHRHVRNMVLCPACATEPDVGQVTVTNRTGSRP